MSDVKVSRWDRAESPRAGDLEAQLKKEGYRTHSWSDSPGTTYGDHEHAYTEVRWVVSGKIKIGSGDQVFELGPGDRLDMPPRTLHWAEVTSDTPVTYLCGEK